MPIVGFLSSVFDGLTIGLSPKKILSTFFDPPLHFVKKSFKVGGLGGRWLNHSILGVLFPYYVCNHPQPPPYLGGRILALFGLFSTTHPTLFHQTFFVNAQKGVRVCSSFCFNPHTNGWWISSIRANLAALWYCLFQAPVFSGRAQVRCKNPVHW